MRYLLLFLIVTVFVALAYSSPVPETAAVAQVKPGALKKGPVVPPAGQRRQLQKGGKRRRLQAGKGGLRRRKLQAGKRPVAGPGGKKRIVKRRRPVAA